MADIVAVKHSFRDGHVALRVEINAYGYCQGHVKVKASTELTIEAARQLAAALLAEADNMDAKAAAKASHEQRCKEWRDREVASGRMRIL